MFKAICQFFTRGYKPRYVPKIDALKALDKTTPDAWVLASEINAILRELENPDGMSLGRRQQLGRMLHGIMEISVEHTPRYANPRLNIMAVMDQALFDIGYSYKI
ncbi:hypothetical protein PHABIO_89 [Pseudomonas phage Phabio]|uniref:Uncharacterized protein n=1 Tax=Pseudomonas phage Phabio TaxID=2006668 RepID=A0A1Y0STS3_9CAUD|nr:hypothetical protein MZD05_gp089 [Pseudomonas phage Phabio]ARV76720.1 hypothetical protein PHABIO_89 [Pseudomonas phage Phabio]